MCGTLSEGVSVIVSW